MRMKTLIYPLWSYNLADGSQMGFILGQNHLPLIEKDLKSLKAAFVQLLQKQYKKHGHYPPQSLEQFKKKRFEIEFRPSYQLGEHNFPVEQSLKIPIWTVYGPSSNGYAYECQLPDLFESFRYQDNNSLSSLLQYYCSNLLNQYQPKSIFRLMNRPEPQLSELQLRIKEVEERSSFGQAWQQGPQLKELPALAELYPPKQADLRKKRLPEQAWEREDVVQQLIDKILNKRANILLVGPPSSGKTVVLQEALRKIQKVSQMGLQFWRINSQRITAQAKYLGEWQQKVESLVEELQSVQGVLWVNDCIRLLQIGGEGAEDSLAAFMSGFISEGKLQLIGELTPKELESLRQKLPSFVQHFQLVQLNQLDEMAVFRILERFAQYAEQQFKQSIQADAWQLAYRLLDRYYPYEHFPGKALRFLDKVMQSHKNQPTIDSKAVLESFSKQTGLPEIFLRDDILLQPEELQDYFSSRLIGQKPAVDALCKLVKIFKVGLNNPSKPIGSLLFAGPTGVGKTAAAKLLADYFFGQGQQKSPLIRIDMSEFQHPAQIERFIGAAGRPGKLVQAVRERPFALLLLDEVEKAHPAIFDSLLSLLDEGRFVDAFGRVTNFKNCIIIMTSNLGASNQSRIGYGQNDQQNYESAIYKFFRPEFINRLDQIVFFKALEEKDIRKILDIELQQLAQREGFKKRELELAFGPALKELLVHKGFDQRYGARPLQRSLERELIAPLANWLLQKDVAVQKQKLYIEYVDGELTIVNL